jgi:hypothetical protein
LARFLVAQIDKAFDPVTALGRHPGHRDRRSSGHDMIQINAGGE